MKRYLAILLMIVLLALSAPAALAETQATGEYDAVVLPAIEVLKNEWRGIYGESAGAGMYGPGFTGYLEIKNTRVIYIKEDPHRTGELSGEEDAAAKFFGDMDYFVDFILYSDYMGSTPYYDNFGIYDCVVVKRDGTVEVLQNPLQIYRGRTYDVDFSGIIEEIVDLNGEYNAVYHLLWE